MKNKKVQSRVIWHDRLCTVRFATMDSTKDDTCVYADVVHVNMHGGHCPILRPDPPLPLRGRRRAMPLTPSSQEGRSDVSSMFPNSNIQIQTQHMTQMK